MGKCGDLGRKTRARAVVVCAERRQRSERRLEERSPVSAGTGICRGLRTTRGQEEVGAAASARMNLEGFEPGGMQPGAMFIKGGEPEGVGCPVRAEANGKMLESGDPSMGAGGGGLSVAEDQCATGSQGPEGLR